MKPRLASMSKISCLVFIGDTIYLFQQPAEKLDV